MALRAVIDHPKFARLKRLLNGNKSITLGYLEALWHFCGRFTPAGDIGKYPDDEIEAWLEWDGTPGELIAAYIEAKWIDRDPIYRLIVHDWHQHADDATRLAIKRAKRQFVGTVQEMSGQCRDSVAESATVSGLPVPEPVPEPEKRSSTLAPSSSELEADDAPKLSPSLALVPDPNPPRILGEFPCDGSPKAWQFTDRDVGKWAELFPSLDVMQELRQCYAWIDASPTRRKTARGMPRTIVAWLGRSQNRGNTHVQPNGNLAAVQGYYAGNGPLANDPLGLGRGTTRQDHPGHN